MKKVLTLAVLMLTVLALLCACGGGGTSETESKTESSSDSTPDSTPGSESTSDSVSDSASESTPDSTPEDKTVDMSGVSFDDVTVEYDGETHSIEIEGTLPEGIASVSYEGNGQTAIGKYTVTANFTVEEGYKAVSPLTATLVIKAKTFDVSGMKFESITVSYDGEEHSIEVVGVPEGVTVTYEGNGKTLAGTYTVTASFTVPEGYSPIASMTATITITEPEYVDGAFTYLDSKKTILYKVNSGLVSTSLVIPDKVKTICDFAIFDLPNLVEIYVPSSVKSIGEYAFGFKGSVDNPTPAGITVYGDAGTATATWCDANGVTFSSENPLGLYIDPSQLYITDGLTMWLDAFDPATTTVDLAGGKWYDKTGNGKYATFKGGNTWWVMRQAGGVGYDMSKAQWDASYKEVGLIFDSNVLPNEGFTVEVLLDARGPSNADGTRYMDSSAKYGIYKADVSAFDFGGLRCMQFGGSTVSSHYMTRWFYHVNTWNAHQKMEWVIKDSTTLADPAIATMSVTYVDMGNEHVVYNMFYNGALDFTFDNTTHNSTNPEKNPHFNTEGGKKYIPMSEGNFSLLNGFPGTLYSVRIYNRTLTDDEVRINHMADLLSYFKIDLEKYGMLFDSQLVELAKALNGFNMGSKKSEIIAALNDALVPRYSATVTVNYQKPDGTVFKTKTYTAMVGDEYSIISPTLNGHYTRDIYVEGTIKGNTTLTVTYKKIPQGVDSAIMKQLLPGVVCWGDSLTAGAGAGNGDVASQYKLNLTDLNGSGSNINYVSTLQNLINQKVATTTVTNCGVGGETSAVIAARAQTETYYLYLGKAVTLSGTSCVIDIQQYATSGRLGILRQGEGNSINDVTITGKDNAGNDVEVKGKISVKLTANAPSGSQLPTCDYQYLEYTFTRTDGKTGTVNFAKDARINTKGSYAYDGQWCILYVGTNGGYQNVQELIKQQEEILAACGCTTNYIIISTSNGNAAGHKAMETALAERWGDHYFSAREYLSSEEAYRTAGFDDSVIEKYESDIQAGIVSEILRVDGVHYNSVGYALLGNRIFRQMVELGYFDPIFDYYDLLAEEQ